VVDWLVEVVRLLDELVVAVDHLCHNAGDLAAIARPLLQAANHRHVLDSLDPHVAAILLDLRVEDDERGLPPVRDQAIRRALDAGREQGPTIRHQQVRVLLRHGQHHPLELLGLDVAGQRVLKLWRHLDQLPP